VWALGDGSDAGGARCAVAARGLRPRAAPRVRPHCHGLHRRQRALHGGLIQAENLVSKRLVPAFQRLKLNYEATAVKFWFQCQLAALHDGGGVARGARQVDPHHGHYQLGRGGLENNHSNPDVDSPPRPPRVCMSITLEGGSCSDLGRVLVLNDPAAWSSTWCSCWSSCSSSPHWVGCCSFKPVLKAPSSRA
jgi:hypothetical protein